MNLKNNMEVSDIQTLIHSTNMAMALKREQSIKPFSIAARVGMAVQSTRDLTRRIAEDADPEQLDLRDLAVDLPRSL